MEYFVPIDIKDYLDEVYLNYRYGNLRNFEFYLKTYKYLRMFRPPTSSKIYGLKPFRLVHYFKVEIVFDNICQLEGKEELETMLKAHLREEKINEVLKDEVV